ncbi:hypothetical protein [Mesorhizobium sp. INR15]|uniref:hypothetical protein n=1 Tax=Mesorhizobium sp. INR15 TaxID=2654248 RepID=UPI001896A451|nr:hypothetical protein [Mesorhizobium sp. INR15]
MNRPFSDRVDDVAKKTGGSVLFDVRVDATGIQRMAAIGYGADGVVAIFIDGNGDITSLPVGGDSDAQIAELAAWGRLPMAQQVTASYLDAATTLIAELRQAGRFDRAS